MREEKDMDGDKSPDRNNFSALWFMAGVSRMPRLKSFLSKKVKLTGSRFHCPYEKI